MIFHKCDICRDELTEDRINEIRITAVIGRTTTNLTVTAKTWEICGWCLERVNDAFMAPPKKA